MDWITALHTIISSGEQPVLATIISTSGSTPAAAFSKMVISSGGMKSVGTVGGGCMEGDVREAALEIFATHRARILTFHLNEVEMIQGLICGGSLDILLEPFDGSLLPLIEEIRMISDGGGDSVLATLLTKEGTLREKALIWTSIDEIRQETSSLLAGAGIDPLEIRAQAEKAHHRNVTVRIPRANGELLLEPIQGNPHLLIFGGGHVSKAICAIAARAGFSVTVIDDRKEYANAERFPEARRTIAADLDDAISQISITLATYIVIVTRGHRSDEEILERVVTSKARYIGMIGSKRKVLATHEHLLDKGIPVDILTRVHAPMGLEIGAITAEEIGVSVVAELIHVRRDAAMPVMHKSTAVRMKLRKQT